MKKNIRYDACIALPAKQTSNTINQKLQKGLYIVASHKGAFSDLTKSYNYIIYEWLKFMAFQLIIKYHLLSSILLII